MVIQPLPSQLCRNKEGNGKKKAGDKQYKKHSTDMFLTSQVNISGCASQYGRSVAGPDRAEAVFVRVKADRQQYHPVFLLNLPHSVRSKAEAHI